MQVDLFGSRVLVIGAQGAIGAAIGAALAANGAAVASATVADAGLPARHDGNEPDILLLMDELQPENPPAAADLQRLAEAAGARMAERGAGRIVFVLSALGAMPMRRHPAFSNAVAAAANAVRTLAMTYAPHVLVNAVGAGAIATEDPGQPPDALAAGSAHMLSHVPLARPGTPDDIAGAVLFLCDPMNTYMTGQMLTVDGGWAAGYGRNF